MGFLWWWWYIAPHENKETTSHPFWRFCVWDHLTPSLAVSLCVDHLTPSHPLWLQSDAKNKRTETHKERNPHHQKETTSPPHTLFGGSVCVGSPHTLTPHHLTPSPAFYYPLHQWGAMGDAAVWRRCAIVYTGNKVSRRVAVNLIISKLRFWFGYAF